MSGTLPMIALVAALELLGILGIRLGDQHATAAG